MWGLDLYLSGCRLRHGEYLILVAPEFSPSPEQEYRLRWGIETLFGTLKSRGFNLEDTRLQDTERVSRLLALLAIALSEPENSNLGDSARGFGSLGTAFAVVRLETKRSQD